MLNLGPCVLEQVLQLLSTSEQTFPLHVALLVSAPLISLLDKSSLNKETSPGPILLRSLCLMRPKERASADLFGCLNWGVTGGVESATAMFLVIDVGLSCPQLQK